MCKKIIVLLLLTISLIAHSSDQNSLNHYFWDRLQTLAIFDPPEHDQIPFADFLYENELFEDAITEYHRFLFAYGKGNNADYARFQIAQCHLKLHQHLDAQAALTEMAYNTDSFENLYSARLIMSLHFASIGKMQRADFEMSELLRNSPNEKHPELNYFSAWIALLDCDFVKATNYFEKVLSDTMSSSYYHAYSYEIHRYFVSTKPKLDKRSPLMARFLSGILPGAGQAYANNPDDAFNSFVINGGLGYLTFSNIVAKNYFQSFYIFYFLWSKFYFGGIELAGKSAVEYGQHVEYEMIKALIDNFIAQPG